MYYNSKFCSKLSQNEIGILNNSLIYYKPQECFLPNLHILFLYSLYFFYFFIILFFFSKQPKKKFCHFLVLTNAGYWEFQKPS